MQVFTFNTQRRFPIDPEQVSLIAQEVVKTEKRKSDEVTVHFVGKKKICSLHAIYFDDPSPTDCISFPIDNQDSPGYQILGEVFVCPEAAFHYVAKHGGDIYEEITLYIVHGLLHLLGYDDIDPEDRLVMREKERNHMDRLKKKKLLLQH